MRIPVSDDGVQHRRLLPSIETTLRQVLLDMTVAMSVEIPALEREVSDFLGGGHAVAVQSGTAAIFLGLKGLGVGPGDEVITVPNSDLVTTSCVTHVGARFVLCDIEPDSMNIDPALIERLVTPQTKAILPVHITGHPADMQPIMGIARRHNLKIIEDACLSLGATYHGQQTALIGDVGCLSFGVGKVISGCGDGGMMITRSSSIAHEVRLLRGVGQYPSVRDVPPGQRPLIHGQQNEREGYFLHMNALQAAVVRLKLPHVVAWQAERQSLAERYATHFAGTPVRAPAVRPGCTHTWRDYIVRLPNRDHVRAALHQRGIATHLRYSPPVHLQPVHRSLGLKRGSFPVAERAADELLGLPMYAGLRAEHVDEVAGAVLDALAARTP